jgi:ketosteroid isomerase-like protein
MLDAPQEIHVIRKLLAPFAGCLLMLAGTIPTLAASPADVEHEIMRLEKDSNDAYAANDLPKYFGYYADDAVLIFYNERTTVPAYRKMWTESVKTEPIASVKLSDVVIRVMPSADAAVASYQIDVRTRHPDGKMTDEHSFETDVWVKRGSVWKLSHVHYSATPVKSTS